MSEPSPIEAASKRLALALDRWRRLLTGGNPQIGRADASRQLHALAADRSRLAAELDAAAARARSLETINRDVAQRLEAAMGAIGDPRRCPL